LIGFAKSAQHTTWTPGTGFTQQAGASSNFLDAETGLAATPGSYNATFEVAGSTTWQAVVAAVSPSAAAGTPNQVNLTWTTSTEVGGTISGYLVERCQGPGCTSFVQIGTSTTTALSDTGLNGSTTYCYRVRAQDAANNIGSYSGLASATTPAPTITAPTNLTTTAASSTQINLSWTAATETGGTISSYLVERCQGRWEEHMSEIQSLRHTVCSITREN